jgi:hypothetical protein
MEMSQMMKRGRSFVSQCFLAVHGSANRRAIVFEDANGDFEIVRLVIDHQDIPVLKNSARNR